MKDWSYVVQVHIYNTCPIGIYNTCNVSDFLGVQRAASHQNASREKEISNRDKNRLEIIEETKFGGTEEAEIFWQEKRANPIICKLKSKKR